MGQNAEDIISHNFASSEELLFDTNIWFFIYGPHKPNDKRVIAYSNALKNILAAKSRIYINVLILSEFINAYARLKWRLLPTSSKYKNFKQFRASKAFRRIAQDISADVKLVLQHCTRIESGFGSLDITNLIDEYAAGKSDFNDQVLTALCKKNGLEMVTDDADFKGKDIPVLTANKRLLV